MIALFEYKPPFKTESLPWEIIVVFAKHLRKIIQNPQQKKANELHFHCLPNGIEIISKMAKEKTSDGITKKSIDISPLS